MSKMLENFPIGEFYFCLFIIVNKERRNLRRLHRNVYKLFLLVTPIRNPCVDFWGIIFAFCEIKLSIPTMILFCSHNYYLFLVILIITLECV